jgi:acyl-CoA thioesterase
MNPAELRQLLQHLYERNVFVRLLKMEITAIDVGRTEITMPVDPEIHTNLYGNAHGGALASLADTAMGVACATLGKRVVTLDFNMNFLRGVSIQPAIKAIATVIHNGSRTMVIECDLVDQGDDLVAKARGTFFTIGKFEGV